MKTINFEKSLKVEQCCLARTSCYKRSATKLWQVSQMRFLSQTTEITSKGCSDTEATTSTIMRIKKNKIQHTKCQTYPPTMYCDILRYFKKTNRNIDLHVQPSPTPVFEFALFISVRILISPRPLRESNKSPVEPYNICSVGKEEASANYRTSIFCYIHISKTLPS